MKQDSTNAGHSLTRSVHSHRALRIVHAFVIRDSRIIIMQ
jgi:hypothetical protein